MTLFDLDIFYDGYPRVEEEFQARLEGSLQPRGPEMMYEIVAGLGLPAGAHGLDVGCGEGDHMIELATRFGLGMAPASVGRLAPDILWMLINIDVVWGGWKVRICA